MNKIQLSDHFDYKRLLRYTQPSILMMIFTSIYSVVDGFFVSNFVGKTPFAAVNFIMPFLMILGAVGFMFGTGGSALIAKTMGEGKPDKAKQLFSLFIYVTIICGIVLAVFGILLIRPIAALLGAGDVMLDHCVIYGRVILIALPAYMLQYEFQSFFAAAEKPQLGLGFTVAAGVTNMVLDALFVAVFKWGLVGAAAYGVLMYVNMIFLAAFIGYSVGTAPIIGYHYGAGNHTELKNLLKRSLVIVGTFSVVMLGLAEGLAKPLAMIFVGYDQALMDLTLRGFMIYSFSFLFAGISIYGSSFFTALNNGLISALISFLRTLLFQVAAVLIFPLIWDIDGIWFSIVAAELMAALVTALFLVCKRKNYHY